MIKALQALSPKHLSVRLPCSLPPLFVGKHQSCGIPQSPGGATTAAAVLD